MEEMPDWRQQQIDELKKALNMQTDLYRGALVEIDRMKAVLIIVVRDAPHTFTERGDNHPNCSVCKAALILSEYCTSVKGKV